MQQSDCETIAQTVNKLLQEINEIDDQVQAHEAEALKQLNPLRYLMLQGEVNRLIREEHAIQGKWSNAMVELAVCRSGHLMAPH
jgi:uncharacterized tellurite resistance protein B-like protein